VNAKWETHNEIKNWLENEGIFYEGIVIHDIDNNSLYKCHRGHLGGSYIWEGYPLPIENI